MIARFAPPAARRPARPPLSWRWREWWRARAARRATAAEPEATYLGAEALHPLLATIRGTADDVARAGD